MSREIDFSEPLSDEDRTWLLANNRDEEVLANDAAHGRDSSDVAARKGSGVSFMTGNEPSLSADRVYPTGLTTVAADADLDKERREAQFKSAMEDGDAPSGVDTGDVTTETDEKPYEDWKGDELRAELGKRELSKSGTNPEMIERLRADDAERESDAGAEDDNTGE